jgi:hypothetical protein
MGVFLVSVKTCLVREFQKLPVARCWWLTRIILATQEAEIRRITVQRQPGQTVYKSLSQKKKSQKRAGGVAQDAGSEFKPQY